MTDWQFDSSQIAAWAEFSGDFNPIHFDVKRARQAGSDAIIVHGMLSLLYVKQEMAALCSKGCNGDGWLAIKCRLKSPVRCGVPHCFSARGETNKGKFSLRDVASNRELIQGTYSTLDAIEPSDHFGALPVSSETLGRRFTQFSNSFLDISDLWIAIDGLVFSEFFNSDITFAMAQDNDMSKQARNHKELMEQVSALQTYHTVKIAPQLLQKRVGEYDAISSIDIRLGNRFAIKNGHSELIASHTLDVFINNEFLMQTETGLQLKLPH